MNRLRLEDWTSVTYLKVLCVRVCRECMHTCVYAHVCMVFFNVLLTVRRDISV